MDSLTVAEIARAVGARVFAGAPERRVSGIAVDTRGLQPGELFVALRGRRADGHQFVPEAVRRGAGAVLVEREVALAPGVAGILVADTRQALLELGGWYRRRLKCRVVGITGSNGKTTTKELLGHLLESRFSVVRARASYNNEIGVPLTVFQMGRATEVGIFEIEMNEPGGTLRLARVCAPEIGVITNVGDTHLEFMKDRAGVAAEKAELLAALPENGFAVVNFDDPLVREMGERACRMRNLRVVTFGFSPEAEVSASAVRLEGVAGSVFLLNRRYPVRLPVPGRHNIGNFLAAAAVAHLLGVDFEMAAQRAQEFAPAPHRLNVYRLERVAVIDDCYNANPQSMAAALEVLKQGGGAGGRVAILGDMLELGAEAERLHWELGRRVAEAADRLVAVGLWAETVARAACAAGMRPGEIRCYPDAAAVGGELFDFLRPGDTILVKGSRALALERITQMIVRHYGKETG